VSQTEPTLPVSIPKELEIDKSGPIRRLVNSKLQQDIEAAIDALPVGRRWAVIPLVDMNAEGKPEFHLAFTGKVVKDDVDIGWSVAITKPWNAPLEFQFGAIVSG
jgi:hypothetical protein